MRKAVPAPLPERSAAGGKDTASTSASSASASDIDSAAGVIASAPAVQPKGSAAPLTTESAAGDAPLAESAAADDIAVSQRVPITTTYPMNIVGKLFAYDAEGNEELKCSASVIVSDTASTIWTAAHCVHRGDGSGSAGFYEQLMFIPAYKDGESPWGLWAATTKYAPTAYTEDTDNLESDFAAVELAPDPTYGKIQDAMGAFGYSFGSGSDYSDVTTAGYPGEGYNRTDLDGEYMMYCYGNAEDYANLNPLDDRIKMDCDMGKGASGGPMVIASDESGLQIIGANSHYIGDASTGERANDDLLSSEHGVRAANVIAAVNDSA
ncbi:hypothetical protein ABT009_40025 [Streptomyces sp. NPDC002896]|uniref:trypsin-like serine peptidase n=1 Tax=Streptomyces sp. NPDC002896 TaxID=3154438 RepID=UPI00331DAB37